LSGTPQTGKGCRIIDRTNAPVHSRAMASDIEIDILIDAADWDERALQLLAVAAAAATLDELGLEPQQFGVSILACDDARIATLNSQFRAKPQPTNVLSWPSEDRAAAAPGEMPHLPPPNPVGPPLELGDIALAHETCTREAAEAGKPFEDHIRHLIVHGLLHLLGFDHETDADAELMEGLETRVLARLGVPDPY
jgi:probable rRNA maturation factor